MSQFSHVATTAMHKDFLISTVKSSSRKVVPVQIRTGIFDPGSEDAKETGKECLSMVRGKRIPY